MQQNNTLPLDQILTTRDAANLLGVAVSTVQKWVESGRLSSWKTPGGHRRIPRPAVEALLCQPPRGPLDAAAYKPAAAGSLTPPELLPHPAPAYPILADEGQRLRAVGATGLLDTLGEAVFDRITWLSSEMLDMPVALITVLTAERQWFKSRFGTPITQTPRAWAFCSHAIAGGNDLLVVEDATLDPRFASNPLVTGETQVRFYAGCVLSDRDGYRLGTLCVLDHQPRQLSAEQLRVLRELAAIAAEEIQRRAAARLPQA